MIRRTLRRGEAKWGMDSEGQVEDFDWTMTIIHCTYSFVYLFIFYSKGISLRAKKRTIIKKKSLHITAHGQT